MTEPKRHDYRPFYGGPPSDTDYEWCADCGVLKAKPSGDPEGFFAPGTGSFDPYGTPIEPPCVVRTEKTTPAMAGTLTAREQVLWEAAVLCGRIARFAVENGGRLPPSLKPEKLYELSARIDAVFMDGYMADDAVAHEVALLGDAVKDMWEARARQGDGGRGE